jgi:hypothetical protein
MQVEAGKRYRRRDGKIITLDINWSAPEGEFPFFCNETEYYYMADGRILHYDCEQDLIEEVYGEENLNEDAEVELLPFDLSEIPTFPSMDAQDVGVLRSLFKEILMRYGIGTIDSTPPEPKEGQLWDVGQEEPRLLTLINKNYTLVDLTYGYYWDFPKETAAEAVRGYTYVSPDLATYYREKFLGA